jgi:hypothetical protein
MTLAQWYSAMNAIEEMRDLITASADHVDNVLKMVRRKDRRERRLKTRD